MKNGAKILAAAVAMLVVLIGAIWWESSPPAPQHHPPAEGTLAHAVAAECDPRRQGSFKGEALKDAATCLDLRAQENMALSTARLVWISWLQIFIAIGGTAAVVWTVLVSLRSIELTRRALEHQQTATRRQLRPSITPSQATVTRVSASRDRIVFSFKNVGASTARRFRQSWSYAIVPTRSACQIDPDTLRLSADTTDVPRDGDCGYGVNLTPEQTTRLRSGNYEVQAAYCAIYDDDMGGRYRYTFGRSFWAPALTEYRALEGFTFTEPELAGREA